MPKFTSESYYALNNAQYQASSGNKLALPHTRLIPSSPSTAPSTPTAPPRLSTRQSRTARIPRPANAWIVFRRANVEGMVLHMEDEIARSSDPGVGVPQAEVSKRLSKIWNGLSAEEKKPYFAQAEIEKEEHARKYPDYQFVPRKPLKAKSAATSACANEYSRAATPVKHKSELASPAQVSAPAPETSWPSSNAAPKMDGDFDVFQDFYSTSELYENLPVLESLQSAPTQQAPDFGVEFMQWLNQASPPDANISSVENWHFDGTEDLSTVFSGNYPVNGGLESFAGQQDFLAPTLSFQSNEAPAYGNQAADLFYGFPLSSFAPSSGPTPVPASSMYPTPSPSPPHLPADFQLNNWDSPAFSL